MPLEPRLPFPVSDVSNGEWIPRPPTERQRAAARLIAEECGQAAKRHAMTRGEFLKTALATTIAFSVLNRVAGRADEGPTAALPVTRAMREDPDAARAALDGKRTFVMDVQAHHVDITLPYLQLPAAMAAVCGLRFLEPDLVCNERFERLGQANFVQEFFVASETDVAVVSGVPQGSILPPATMAATRDLVNQMAGSERALAQAMIDPKEPAGRPTALDTFEQPVRGRGARALKCYTYQGDWWLDDEVVAYPMYEEARRLGITLVNCHKGLPRADLPTSAEYVRTRDFPKALADWPDLRFCAYHAGYFPDASRNSEFLAMAAAVPKKQRRRLYAEIGSSFALNLLGGATEAAVFVAQLVKVLGPRNVLWGTDCIWWGSPQFLIDAMKLLRVPDDVRERRTLPQLTTKTKRRILGLNAAGLYGVDPRARRTQLDADRVAALRAEVGGARHARSLACYGPRTRREFLAMLRHAGRPPAA
jgi:predicted TIM-barrel fold metal-dependent hydrolase